MSLLVLRQAIYENEIDMFRTIQIKPSIVAHPTIAEPMHITIIVLANMSLISESPAPTAEYRPTIAMKVDRRIGSAS